MIELSELDPGAGVSEKNGGLQVGLVRKGIR